MAENHLLLKSEMSTILEFSGSIFSLPVASTKIVDPFTISRFSFFPNVYSFSKKSQSNISSESQKAM